MIQDRLFELQDEKYRNMQIKIIPTVNPNTIIGVRTPDLRRLAKELLKGDYKSFINDLPHKYFDENQLHAFIISGIKDYDECLEAFNKFLPYIDNWATCDQQSPKVFNKNVNKDKLIKEIKKWIKSKEYYVNMMIAWYFATALAKQYDSTIPYIEENKLDIWVHNKTIQKSVESFRITDEHKEHLRSLRRK